MSDRIARLTARIAREERLAAISREMAPREPTAWQAEDRRSTARSADLRASEARRELADEKRVR